MFLISCTITETPDIPRSKFHTHFSLNWFLQSIHPSLCPCITFHNVLVLYTKQCLSLSQCPSWRTMPWRLLAIAYAVSHSYLYIWVPCPSTTEDVHGMMPRYPLNMEENSCNIFLFISASRSLVSYFPWYIIGSNSPDPLLIYENSNHTKDNQ